MAGPAGVQMDTAWLQGVLWRAAKGLNVKWADELLSEGLEPNFKIDGRTPLTVVLLRGAGIEKVTPVIEGEVSLFNLVDHFVRALLQAGARVTAEDISLAMTIEGGENFLNDLVRIFNASTSLSI